jgi:HK97 family phage major capsid protein
MSDDTNVQDTTKTVRDRLAELVGMDISKADNDEFLVAAVTEYVNDIESAVERRAKEIAADDVQKAQLAAEAAKAIDFEREKDNVLERAAELREVRKAEHRQSMSRRGEENIEEVGKAAKDIVAKAIDLGSKRAVSGITILGMSGMPMGLSELISRKSSDPAIVQLQRANDDMLLVANVLGYGTKNRPYDRLSDLAHWGTWSENFGEVSKALSVSSTDTSGYWTPTFYSSDMIETLFEATDVASLFPRYPWAGPGSTMTIPAEGTEINIYTAGEATTDDDDPKFTASDPGIGTSVTVTARAFAARTVWSYEMQEDALFDILEHVRMKFVRAFARDLDRALLDGDSDGTHQDTGLTLVADDHRRLFNGLRKRGLSETAAKGFVDAGTHWNAETVYTPLLNMGAFSDPANTVCICGHPTMILLGFLRDTQNQRLEGSNAPLTSGRSTLPGGWAIVPSAMVRNDLNASGIYDGSTKTKTYLLWVDKRAWQIHEKVGLTVGVKDEPDKAQREVYARQRLAFTHIYGAAGTDRTTTMVYNFANTSFPA